MRSSPRPGPHGRALAVLAAAAAVACGGSGGGGTVAQGASAVVVSGQSYKGPAAGATVCAYRVDAAQPGGRGAQVAAQPGSTPAVADGCVVTANDGSYSLVLPADTTGDLLLESRGGTYCSDESVYDGAACGGGGRPIAMGDARLRTVVVAGSGPVTAPMTLLTTAAVERAGSGLSAASFGTAYAAIAAGVGVAPDPAAAPGAGPLATLLASLTTYVGGDTSTLASVTGGLASGQLTAAGGALQPAQGFVCTAVGAQDRNLGFALSSCTDLPDGGSRRISYRFSWSELLNADGAVQGGYSDQTFTGSCARPGEPLGDGSEGLLAVFNEGVQTLPLQASADPARAQSGTANRLVFRVSSRDPDIVPTVTPVLYCKTRSAVNNVSDFPPAFSGFLSSPSSPTADGFPTRIDPSKVWVAVDDI